MKRLDMLYELAERLEKDIFHPGCDPKTLAPLAKQYRETLKEIEEIEGKVSEDDDIEALLSARKADGKPDAIR